MFNYKCRSEGIQDILNAINDNEGKIFPSQITKMSDGMPDREFEFSSNLDFYIVRGLITSRPDTDTMYETLRYTPDYDGTRRFL